MFFGKHFVVLLYQKPSTLTDNFESYKGFFVFLFHHLWTVTVIRQSSAKREKRIQKLKNSQEFFGKRTGKKSYKFSGFYPSHPNHSYETKSEKRDLQDWLGRPYNT